MMFNKSHVVKCLKCIVISFLGLPLYDPSKDFTCLDGSQLLSFSSVNDDYCDCADGSDEPGPVVSILFNSADSPNADCKDFKI